MAWAEPAGKGQWRGRYYVVIDKKRVPKTAGYANTKRKAEKLGEDEEAKIRAGTWFDPDAGKITFSEYYENHWLPNRAKELNTLANYRSQYNAKRHGLKVQWGDWELRRIHNSDVQGWVTKMIAAGLSPATIEARFVTFQTVLAARKGTSAIRDQKIQNNPCQGVEIPKRVKKRVQFYEPDQVETLLDHLDSWWAPIPFFDSETGLRWGELMGVQVDDFTPGFRSFYVNRVILQLTIADTGNGTPFLVKEYAKEGADAEIKHVALSEEAAWLVEQVVNERRLKPGDRLFSMPDKTPPPEWHPPLSLEWEPLRTDVWPNGLPIDRNFFRKEIWHPALDAAGLPRRKFHALRASHITWLLSGGAELPAVMERVGHTQFTTTKRYTGVMEEADKRTLGALSSVKSRYAGRHRAQ